jgi:hypothetical protein
MPVFDGYGGAIRERQSPDFGAQEMHHLSKRPIARLHPGYSALAWGR